MGLSNIQRELILKQQSMNHYENNLKPISKQIELHTVCKIHEMIIEGSKKIKVKKNKELKKEITINKTEVTDIEEKENLDDKIHQVKQKNKDLKTAVLNDIEYVDYSKIDRELDPPSDLSSEQIGEPYVSLSGPINEELDEEVDEEVKDIKENIVEKNKEDKDSIPDKASLSNSLDTDFFMAMTNIESKKDDVKQTYKSNDLPVNEQPGGANIKKIQLTEKYDFF